MGCLVNILLNNLHIYTLKIGGGLAQVHNFINL